MRTYVCVFVVCVCVCVCVCVRLIPVLRRSCYVVFQCVFVHVQPLSVSMCECVCVRICVCVIFATLVLRGVSVRVHVQPLLVSMRGVLIALLPQ